MKTNVWFPAAVSIRFFSACLVLLFSAGTAQMVSAAESQAEQLPEEKAHLLEQVYSLTGLEQQFVALGYAMTEEGLRMGRTELPDNDMSRNLLERLETGLKEKYSVPKMRAVVMQVLDRELDEATLRDILGVIGEPVWQQAVKLEQDASQPDNQLQLENYVTVRLQQALPRQARLDMISELAEKSGGVDLTMDMMASGAISAAQIIMGEESNLPAGFEQGLRQEMQTMRAEYQEMVIRQMLYTYRYMSDKSLRQYVSSYDQPAVRSLNRAMTTALSEAFR